MSALVEATDLYAGHKGVAAVRDLNLTVGEGQGVIGLRAEMDALNIAEAATTAAPNNILRLAIPLSLF